MRDTLPGRVGRIVSGGVNALVDALEGAMPETVMQESMREVDDVIADVRAELGKVIAERHLANKQLIEKSSRHGELTDQIGVALEEGREELAQAAVEKQLDIEAQTPVLEATIGDLTSTEKELEGYIEALKAKRREMETEFQALLKAKASQPGAASASASTPGSSADTRAERATSAFDRMLAKNGAMGVGGIDAKREADLAELDQLARQNRVKERLAQFKSRAEKGAH
ncbi:MAG: PspA/IM30 family protein [Sphingomonadales bacterium]